MIIIYYYFNFNFVTAFRTAGFHCLTMCVMTSKVGHWNSKCKHNVTVDLSQVYFIHVGHVLVLE